MKFFRATALITITALLFVGAFFAEASHSWGGYHWARTANPFSLKLGDNVTSAWDGHFMTASADWSLSSVLDTSIVAGATNPKNCRPKSGQVEVCDSKYGFNGWLGIASIWVSGSHIVQGSVKLNDTYFNTSTYNTPDWRRYVVCQEVGHTLGLGHQDEDFNNADLGTCMDYTRNPGLNLSPNQHDYGQLEAIYAHLDSSTTLALGTSSKGHSEVTDDPASWGTAIKHSKDGKSSLHEKDLGHGNKVFTFVIWAK